MSNLTRPSGRKDRVNKDESRPARAREAHWEVATTGAIIATGLRGVK